MRHLITLAFLLAAVAFYFFSAAAFTRAVCGALFVVGIFLEFTFWIRVFRRPDSR